MRLADEPLVNRREVLRALRVGAPTTDAPFHRLRSQRLASPGWSVPIRGGHGRLAGRLHVYSALNVDAARWARRGRRDIAKRLATRAHELERTDAARELREAIVKASERLSAHLGGLIDDDAWSDRLQRYLDLRRGVGWESLDRGALARDWLVHSEAWLHLDPERTERLGAAVRALDAGAQAARAETVTDEHGAIDGFTGVVEHLDPDHAELVSDTGQAWIAPRRELDREGLAQLGEAVSLIREELPGGGQAWLAAPAVDLRARSAPPPRGGNEVHPFIPATNWLVAGREAEWVTGALRRDPFVVAGAPVPVRDD